MAFQGEGLKVPWRWLRASTSLSLSLSVPVSPLLQIVSAGVLPLRFNPVMSGNSSCTPSLFSASCSWSLSLSLSPSYNARSSTGIVWNAFMQHANERSRRDLVGCPIRPSCVANPWLGRATASVCQIHDRQSTSERSPPGCSRQSCVPSYVCHILIHDSLQQQAYQ